MFPEQILNNLQTIAEQYTTRDLRERYGIISNNYRSRTIRKLDMLDAVAYACARMPATYAAISYVLDEFRLKVPDYEFREIADFGSGCGALMCHFAERNIEYYAIDQSAEMLEVGHTVISGTELSPHVMKDDILKYLQKCGQYDCGFFVYSLNELTNKEEVLLLALEKTRDYLFVIEAGTPIGYENILLAKKIAKQQGVGIVAPCCCHDCPLSVGDWCHFSVRLQRSARHNLIKDSRLVYEDEKFSYVIFSKVNSSIMSDNRIIKRPMKKKGHVIFDICRANGNIDRIVSSDKSLKKKEWGEELPVLS